MRTISLSKRGRFYYFWMVNPETGKRRKISTGCAYKADAARFAQEFLSGKSLESLRPVRKPEVEPAPASPVNTYAVFRTEFLAYDQTPVLMPMLS